MTSHSDNSSSESVAGQQDPTVAELVRSVPPLEDSGASTSDRYDWQAAMAAADGLDMYYAALSADGALPAECESSILCEWQEDWVLLEVDAAQLVSAKHRDPQVSVFRTMNHLADEGGLAHMFNRWSALSERPFCRMVTTAGLAAGQLQALKEVCIFLAAEGVSESDTQVGGKHYEIMRPLRDAISSHSKETRTRWAGDTSSPPIPQNEQIAEVARFCSVLRIDEGKPLRAYVEYAAPVMYTRPVLNKLGVTGSEEAVWEAVMRLFRARMRAKGPLPTAELPDVLRGWKAHPSSNQSPIDRNILRRVVTMSDLDVAIRSALQYPGGYRPVRHMPLTTRLAVKMGTGGCSDNAISRAERLRMDYTEYWRGHISGEVSARSEKARLERRLLRINDKATGDTPPVGSVLWQRIQEGVDDIPLEGLPAGMDNELALGGICELSSRCEVWFSPRFDVEAEIQRLRAESGANE